MKEFLYYNFTYIPHENGVKPRYYGVFAPR